jgi:natural product precursor
LAKRKGDAENLKKRVGIVKQFLNLAKMKKLKMQDLSGSELLTKEQLKNILGGSVDPGSSGGCAYLSPHGSATGGPVVTYNVSKADAQAGAADANGKWCCDSCSTASWYGI